MQFRFAAAVVGYLAIMAQMLLVFVLWGLPVPSGEAAGFWFVAMMVASFLAYIIYQEWKT